MERESIQRVAEWAFPEEEADRAICAECYDLFEPGVPEQTICENCLREIVDGWNEDELM